MGGTAPKHSRSRILAAAAILTLAAWALLGASNAWAVDEVPPATPQGGGCGSCHTDWNVDFGADCARCHTHYPDGADGDTYPEFPFAGEYAKRGPHGAYSTTSNRCEMCHTLHDAPTGFRLLAGSTVKATCFTCHDGTGGMGVYGTIKARTGSDGAGGHGIEVTAVIPGGSATSGGSATGDFRGPSDYLTCSDCHSPHDSNTVEKFSGERIRHRGAESPGPVYSNKLLKRTPTGSDRTVTEYGSDWCIGCHQGRASGGAVHNHPVDAGASAYTYQDIPVYLTTDDTSWRAGTLVRANWGVQLGTLGGLMYAPRHDDASNEPPEFYDNWIPSSGWLMAYPRDALQVGHGPICQQCHEDSREAGELRNNGTEVWMQPDVVTYGDKADGYLTGLYQPTPDPNPRFQNFPHETENASLLLETGDDLCMNCHPPSVLP